LNYGAKISDCKISIFQALDNMIHFDFYLSVSSIITLPFQASSLKYKSSQFIRFYLKPQARTLAAGLSGFTLIRKRGCLRQGGALSQTVSMGACSRAIHIC